MKDNIVQQKSYAFAVRIVRVSRFLAAKMAVAYKEARETAYWLRLLKDTDHLTATQFDIVRAEAEELCRIIAAIQKSTKANSPRNPSCEVRSS